MVTLCSMGCYPGSRHDERRRLVLTILIWLIATLLAGPSGGLAGLLVVLLASRI